MSNKFSAKRVLCIKQGLPGDSQYLCEFLFFQQAAFM